MPTAYNSKTVRGIEMKFGRVVDNHKLINEVITVEILDFYEILSIKIGKL